MRTTKLKHILGVRLVHQTSERRVRMGNVMVQTVSSAQLSASTSSCSGTSPPVPSGLSMNSRWGRTDGSRERSTWLRWNGRGVDGRGRVLTFGGLSWGCSRLVLVGMLSINGRFRVLIDICQRGVGNFSGIASVLACISRLGFLRDEHPRSKTPLLLNLRCDIARQNNMLKSSINWYGSSYFGRIPPTSVCTAK
nr:hypothetical protein Iba_chr04dCG13780 [Ipomoea batatas]